MMAAFSDSFIRSTKDCIAFLEEHKGEWLDTIDDPRWKVWHKAAYHEPDFICYGNYLKIYDQYADTDTEKLDLQIVLGCITFCLRQMRHTGYYTPIEDGELLRFLKRWLELAAGQAGSGGIA